MHINIQSKDLANLEKTLKRRIGGKAAQDFMKRVANEAVREAETATVNHLAAKFHISTAMTRRHIYFRQRSDGKRLAISAWSPTRTVPIKRLNPVQTFTGVRWKWAGRSRSRKSAFLWQGHAFRRARKGGRLVPRLPIQKIRGPKIAWDDAWNEEIHNMITRHFFSSAEAWLNEPVRK